MRNPGFTRRGIGTFMAGALLVIAGAQLALAQTTSFSYQGRLTDGGTAANGNYDLQFALWDSASGGTQIGSTLTVSTVAVSNGVFTVQLDFGTGGFNGANRFLEISARPTGGGTFVVLAPRQPVNSTPYAIRTLNATSADGLSTACVNCVQDSQISSVAGSKVNGAIPVAGLPGGSANYIQNSTTQQAASDFNISGNGTIGSTGSANIFNAVTQYNLNGNRVLSTPSLNNLFVGRSAGAANTGNDNTFVGTSAGRANTTGTSNSFFGANNGIVNDAGSGNSFFGFAAGNANTSGTSNSFFGYFTGLSNTTESNNTFVGFRSNGTAGITNATAIGASSQVNQSNSLVLGSIAGLNSAIANTNVGIGTAAPAAALHVVGPAGATNVDALQVLQVIGGKGGFLGKKGSGILIQAGDGGDDVSLGGTGGSITLVPGAGGSAPIQGTRGAVDVTGIAVVRGSGTFANNLGAADVQVGYGVAGPGTVGNVPRLAIQPYGHTGGPWIFKARDDATKAYLDWVYGPAPSATGITQDSSGNVGIGIGNPAVKFQVFGDIRIGNSGTNGCLQRFDGTALTGSCSSDVRLKRNITPFPNLLDKLTRLQPVNYYWRSAEYPDKHFGNSQSFGLVAQDVERVLPELVGKDEQGYKTVDYGKLPLMLLQAIKEQQAEIETLRKTNAAMSARLRKLEQSRRKR